MQKVTDHPFMMIRDTPITSKEAMELATEVLDGTLDEYGGNVLATVWDIYNSLLERTDNEDMRVAGVMLAMAICKNQGDEKLYFNTSIMTPRALELTYLLVQREEETYKQYVNRVLTDADASYILLVINLVASKPIILWHLPLKDAVRIFKERHWAFNRITKKAMEYYEALPEELKGATVHSSDLVASERVHIQPSTGSPQE